MVGSVTPVTGDKTDSRDSGHQRDGGHGRDSGHGLRSPDKNVRIDAAVAIGTGGDGRHVPALVTALASEHDFFVRETLVWALVHMGTTAVPSLVDLLRGGDVEAQRSAVQVLGKLGDSSAVPALLDALPTAAPPVRDRIVFSLGQIGDPATLPTLVGMLGGVCGESATTLTTAIETFGADAFDVLAARRDDPDAGVRAQVVDLLGFMGSPSCLAPLADAAEDDDADVRVRALTALAATMPAANQQAGQEDLDRVAQTLRRAIEDPDRRVQLLAGRALEATARDGYPTTSST